MLKAKKIEKRYGSLQVLKGIDLQIQKGEIVSIVGASGAGKTTLLQILGTLESADKGELSIGETSVFNLSGNDLARFRNKNIGFIFQFHNLLPEFTAFENICMPAWMGHGKEDEISKRAKDLMEILGIADKVGNKPSELSGGEQQRTAVARALINQPDIIFADEPSGNLDSKNAKELHQLFFKLRDEFHQSFVVVTHNEELADQADRKLEIVDGLIV